MATELKPCPFCGGKPFVSARLPYFGETPTVAIVCEDCNAASKHKVKEEDAIEAWNRRAADYLIANGVTFAPEVPGPEIADPNIMELCFHNGENHMKEKVISILDAFDKDYTCGDPYIEYDALRKAMEGL